MFIILNALYKNEIIDPRNKAYGVNYDNKDQRPPYTKTSLQQLCTPEIIAADKQLNAIGRAALNVNIEAYPTLQATGLYRDLQAQIEGTENRVTVALGDWNNAITAYNTKLVRFPGNIIAGIIICSWE